MPTIRHLLEPILDGGIQNTNYFNGRVLTAEDLSTDQAAGRERLSLLGRAVGEGVAHGLQVTRVAASQVRVMPGEAISRAGQVLTLPGATPILLEIVPDASAAAQEPGLFYNCAQQVVSTINTGYGIYMLVAGPATGYDGSAPSTGAAGGSTITGCGKKYVVDGIQFRLAAYRTDDALSEYKPLRNLVAHDFFGTRDTSMLDLSRIFRPRTAYGDYDAVFEDGRIATSEVPLALLYWGAEGIEWVDMWSVRRRLAPHLSGTPWDVWFGPRRQAETEAMVMQFSADLADYRKETGKDVPPLKDRFRYLPPVGTLPVKGEAWQEMVDAYFNMWHEVVWVPRPYLRAELAQAALTEPIDLETESEPMISVVWEEGMPEAIFYRGAFNRYNAR